jgi:hypothetical protein
VGPFQEAHGDFTEANQSKQMEFAIMDQRKADKEEEKINTQVKGIAREDRSFQGRGRQSRSEAKIKSYETIEALQHQQAMPSR